MKEEIKFKEKPLSFIYQKILNIDGIFLAGEGIKDLVVCWVVINILLNHAIPVAAKLYLQVLFYFGIMLVPIHYAIKWLDIIFTEDNK